MQLIFVLVVATVAVLVPDAHSYCFYANECYDPDTKEAIEATSEYAKKGWTTKSCLKCACQFQRQHVATCFSIDRYSSTPRSSSSGIEKTNKVGENLGPNQSAWKIEDNAVEEVFLLPVNVSSFKCPETLSSFPLDFEWLSKSRLKQVNYIIDVPWMSCCSSARPIQVDRRCEVRWNTTACSYVIKDRETGGPCLFPHSMVGK